MPQVITIYRNENKVLCTDCRDADYDNIIVCKNLFLDMEKDLKNSHNSKIIAMNQIEPIIIQSITFTI